MEIAEKGRSFDFSAYREALICIYQHERSERHYYPLIQSLLQSLCSPEEIVIDVSDSRQTKLHNRSAYADFHAVPDLIVVPSDYHYASPKGAYLFLEIKMPDLVVTETGRITRYSPLQAFDSSGCPRRQLLEKSRRSPLLIYTDCVTWYFFDFLNGTAAPLHHTIQLLLPGRDVWYWSASPETDQMLPNQALQDAPTAWSNLKCCITDWICTGKQRI